MRGEQLARQWKIIRLLEARKHGLTAAEISESLDSHVRTIYRDLEAIQEAGFPLYIEKVEKSSYWKLMDGFRTNLPLPFTATELMSLHMSHDIIRVFVAGCFEAVGGRARVHPATNFGDNLQIDFPAADQRSEIQGRESRKPVLLLGHFDTVYPLGTLVPCPATSPTTASTAPACST